jgi:hypothetical protein
VLLWSKRSKNSRASNGVGFVMVTAPVGVYSVSVEGMFGSTGVFTADHPTSHTNSSALGQGIVVVVVVDGGTRAGET